MFLVVPFWCDLFIVYSLIYIYMFFVKSIVTKRDPSEASDVTLYQSRDLTLALRNFRSVFIQLSNSDIVRSFRIYLISNVSCIQVATFQNCLCPLDEEDVPF